MSIKLPVMRMLCYRWMLPQTVAESCDYYFLDRPSFPDFANSLKIMVDGKVMVERHGIDFEVVFQNGAEVTYADCMKKELQGDPCVQVTFWCSFRSLTFEWDGVTHTRSVVLVQPAREKVRSRAPNHSLFKEAHFIAQAVCNEHKSKAAKFYELFTPTFADHVANSLDKMENEE